jgi:hypothetical protein
LSGRASAAAPTTAVRTFAAFLVARAVFGIAYLGAAFGRLPIFWYAPIDHSWRLAATATGQAMGWYGLTVAAAIAATLAGSATYLASGRGPFARALAKGSVVLAVAHAGALVLMVDFVYFGWTLTHQTPTPWTLGPCAP